MGLIKAVLYDSLISQQEYVQRFCSKPDGGLQPEENVVEEPRVKARLSLILINASTQWLLSGSETTDNWYNANLPNYTLR